MLISNFFYHAEFIAYFNRERVDALQIVNLRKFSFDGLNFIMNQIVFFIEDINEYILGFR